MRPSQEEESEAREQSGATIQTASESWTDETGALVGQAATLSVCVWNQDTLANERKLTILIRVVPCLV